MCSLPSSWTGKVCSVLGKCFSWEGIVINWVGDCDVDIWISIICEDVGGADGGVALRIVYA
jgi:hypothetical protein